MKIEIQLCEGIMMSSLPWQADREVTSLR